MDLSLRRGNADSDDRTLAVLSYCHRHKDSSAHDRPSDSHLLVASVEYEVGASTDRAAAPSGDLVVEELSGAGDLRRRDLEPAELLGDLLDATCRDAVDVHLCDGKLERALSSFATLKRVRVETLSILRSLADLRDPEVELTDAGCNPLGLEAVRVPTPRLRALVGRGVQVVGAFEEHGFVHQYLDRVSEPVETMLGQEFQDEGDLVSVGVVVRHRWWGGVVVITTKANDDLPHNRHATNLPLRGEGRSLTRLAGSIRSAGRSRNYRTSDTPPSLTPSMSGKGDCWDNAVMESFFGSYKQECAHRERWSSLGGARLRTADYIESFYNQHRLHSALDLRTPVEVDMASRAMNA